MLAQHEKRPGSQKKAFRVSEKKAVGRLATVGKAFGTLPTQGRRSAFSPPPVKVIGLFQVFNELVLAHPGRVEIAEGEVPAAIMI